MSELSEHFTLEELSRSQTAVRLGISNVPNRDQVEALTRLSLDLLEPARALLEVPLLISSGFRCPQLNVAVGGQPSSAHLDGRAADFTPGGEDLEAAFEILSESALPFDQLILESGAGSAWIHIASARTGQEPRRQALHLTKRPLRQAIG